MYGLIGKFAATPGSREELLTVLMSGIEHLPGCLSYIVARDPEDENGIWVTEVWDSQESHKASLQLPAVKQAIARAMPIIASFDAHFETEPVGGYGLQPADLPRSRQPPTA
jgi:quinol monooxygenase YgiN